FRVDLTAIFLAYLLAPTACVFFAGAGPAKAPGVPDFLAIALLWFPLEFSGAVANLIPRSAQGFLHSVAYGTAILLGLSLFLCFRSFPGMKYRAPAGRDWLLPLIGFAAVAPVLIAVGIAIGFIPGPHLPSASPERMAAAIGIIFAGTALP